MTKDHNDFNNEALDENLGMSPEDRAKLEQIERDEINWLSFFEKLNDGRFQLRPLEERPKPYLSIFSNAELGQLLLHIDYGECELKVLSAYLAKAAEFAPDMDPVLDEYLVGNCSVQRRKDKHGLEYVVVQFIPDEKAPDNGHEEKAAAA